MKVRQPIVATTLAALAAGCDQSPDPGGLPPAVDAVFADYAAAEGPGYSGGVIRDGRLIGAQNLRFTRLE